MNIIEYGKLMGAHAPCEEGAAAFSSCKNRKDVFELIGSPKAADFFLNSVKDGWGPSPEDFEHVFRPYINGGLTIVNKAEDRKVRSQIWCRTDEVEVENDIRWLILIGCRGEVNIKEWQVVKIFLDRYCSVRINCAPNSIVYVENYDGDIRSVTGNCKITRK